MEIVKEPLVKYDWASWTDGQTRRATQGIDFFCTPVGFKTTLASHARRNGFDVVTKTDGPHVTFRFILRGEGGE